MANASTSNSLRSMIKSSKPEFIFISETKCTLMNSIKILSNFSDYDHAIVPAVGRSGGLWFLWQKVLNVSILHSSKNLIHTTVSGVQGDSDWDIIGVYGSPYLRSRREVWEQIKGRVNNIQNPYCCIGDFNAITNASEKRGGSRFNYKAAEDFNDMVMCCNLMDLGYSGPAYTWTNKRQARFNICERLDRALANSSWRLQYPTAHVSHLPAVNSDHCPILLHTVRRGEKRRSQFKFEAHWFLKNGFREFVEGAWNNTAQDRLEKKLQIMKPLLRQWSAHNIGHLKKEIRVLERRLSEIQFADPTVANLAESEEIVGRLNELMNMEEQYWRQRARKAELKDGDRNTKYFHTSAVMRRRRNQILALKLKDDTWSYDEDEISNRLVQHFFEATQAVDVTQMQEGFVMTENPISHGVNTQLGAVPDRDEIFNALASMGPTKAPGPDGYPAIFYQKCWPFIGNEVTEYIQNIFSNAAVPQAICHTLLALLPKVKNPNTPADFRPISLCNVIYKLITKILTVRIRPVLSNLISENQNAFVPGRQICDNFVIANEILHFMKNSKAADGYFALKVDLAKAYDRVNWEFLSKVLVGFGFRDKTHDLIMSCVISPTFSILVNGRTRGFFKAKRGLRQGCPLSPYLFILTSELLSRLFLIYERDGLYNGIKINRYAPSISHLLFADDLLLFGKGTDETIATLKEILETYTNWSGQCINYHKSSIHFSSTVCNLSRMLFPLRLGVKEMSKEDRYLGNYLLLPKHVKSSYDFLISSCRNKLAGWKRNSLSHAGRSILLKSALSNVPIYYLSTGLVPKGVVEKISQIQRAFWWGHDVGTKKLHLINWNWFIKPKCMGGLGVRDLGIMNQALVSKLAWRFISNPEALWVRLLSARYLRNSSFWEVTKSNNASFSWKGMLAQREVLAKGCCWLIGNGRKVKIWLDPWIPLLTNNRVPPSLVRVNEFQLVSDLIDHESRSWKVHLLHQLFDPSTVNAILNISLAYTTQDDVLVWTKAKSGRFSSKSVYQEIFHNLPSSSANPAQHGNDWNCFWKLSFLIPKVHLFLWRLLHNGLGVAKRLITVLENVENNCAICGLQEESIEHALMHCDHARATWLLSPLGIRTSTLTGNLISLLWEWISNCDQQAFTIMANLLWMIWKHRWRFIKEGIALIPCITVREALTLSVGTSNMNIDPDQPSGHVPDCNIGRNIHMDDGLVKINTDGGLRNGMGAAAAVIRDENGRFVRGRSTLEPTMCGAYMEATAIKMGLMEARELGLKKIRILSDALGIIQAITEGNLDFPWQARLVVAEIIQLKDAFEVCAFTFIRRELNGIADTLVRVALDCNLSQAWNSTPACIQSFVTTA